MTKRRQSSDRKPRIALALAGGGPLGGIYEIGALCALEESLVGLDFTQLQHYVGVSAGGFIAASLANGFTPRELCTSFIESERGVPGAFDPALLMTPAYTEFAQRAMMLPGLVMGAAWYFTTGHQSVIRALERLSPSLPTGLFSNEQIHRQLSRLYGQAGRTNDFRQLKAKLTLVATDLNTGEAVPFGRPGWDHVPISRAVQASSALPGLFPPVAIEGRHYVDGALKKTMHASVAMDDGAELVICLNPLVPFNATPPQGEAAEPRIPSIVKGGLPLVLSQTFRSLIHSRMALGMRHYERAYPGTDIVLIEPDHRDPEMYLANTFSYARRRELAEHAYQQTRQLLRDDAGGLVAKLARHGIGLRHSVLDDQQRALLSPRAKWSDWGHAMQRLGRTLDDLSHVMRGPGGACSPSLVPKSFGLG